MKQKFRQKLYLTTRYLHAVFSATKSFAFIAEADVVIFHLGGSEILTQILPDVPRFYLTTEGDVLYLHPQVIYRWICSALKLKKPRLAYYLAVLQSVNPKLVITFIDNDLRFYKLANLLESATFIAVQNGWRTPFPVPLQVRRFNTAALYLCFGQNEIDENAKQEFICRDSMPVGPVRSALMRRTRDIKIANHLVVPLCTQAMEWREFTGASEGELIDYGNLLLRRMESELNATSDHLFYNSIGGSKLWILNDILLLHDLKRFLSTHTHLTATILLRPGDGEPRDFIDGSVPGLSEHPVAVHRPPNWYSNYDRVLEAELLIAAGSTLTIEGLGLGVKTLISQRLALPGHTPTLKPDWWLLNYTYDQFECTADRLLLQTNREFLSQYAGIIEFYTGRFSTGQTLQLIGHEINKALKTRR